MVNKINKYTVVSLVFGFLVSLTYCLRFLIDSDIYRKLLSLITLFIFYPSLLISLFFSIKSFYLISKTKQLKNRALFIFFNSLIFIFFIYFMIKMIIVLITPI